MAEEIAVLAGGCFWCTEAIFLDVVGVKSVESGYTGGNTVNPTYKQVCGGDTGHAEAIRVTEPGGLLFHRDLARPGDEDQLQKIVETYAGDATPYQRRLFANSLRAALTVNEMQNLVAGFGGAPDAVQMTSDRHWTWAATKH